MSRSLSAIVSAGWDVLVVGAGPAGSIAARAIAVGGARVLLVDRGEFPRPKVCGCCLGPMGLAALAQEGIDAAVSSRGLSRVRLQAAGRSVEFPLRRTRTMAREDMDLALVRAAQQAGATLLERCRARIDVSTGRVTLEHEGSRAVLGVPVVVDAAGLRARPGEVGRDDHIGLGATLADVEAVRDRLVMIVEPEGYLGLAPLPDGRVAAAAAVRAGAIRARGSRRAILERMLRLAGVPEVEAASAAFVGVPPVRSARPAEEGSVLRVGDAARFVEPITGEGMGWAMASGRAVAPHVLARLRGQWRAGAWASEHRRLLRPAFARCAAVAALVHHPRVLGAALWSAGLVPTLGDRVVQRAAGRSEVAGAGV